MQLATCSPVALLLSSSKSFHQVFQLAIDYTDSYIQFVYTQKHMSESSSIVPTWAKPNTTVGEVRVHHGTTDNDNESMMERPFHSTLDEPVKETIMRDVQSVWKKIKVVLLPIRKVCPRIENVFF